MAKVRAKAQKARKKTRTAAKKHVKSAAPKSRRRAAVKAKTHKPQTRTRHRLSGTSLRAFYAAGPDGTEAPAAVAQEPGKPTPFRTLMLAPFTLMDAWFARVTPKRGKT